MQLYVRPTIKEVTAQWKRQYFDARTNTWGRTISGDTEIIWQRLMKARNIDQVKKIIGTAGWAELFCSECCEYSKVGIIFRNHDQECNVCDTCVRKAARLMRSA